MKYTWLIWYTVHGLRLKRTHRVAENWRVSLQVLTRGGGGERPNWLTLCKQLHSITEHSNTSTPSVKRHRLSLSKVQDLPLLSLLSTWRRRQIHSLERCGTFNIIRRKCKNISNVYCNGFSTEDFEFKIYGLQRWSRVVTFIKPV
jgi:hypothetical protein